MNQCADTTRIAWRRGIICPSARQARVKSLSSSVFIGLPCPMNSAAMRVACVSILSALYA